MVDNSLLLSDAQNIQDTGASTSHVDSLAAGDAISPGARIKVSVNTAYARAAGASTLVVTLQCDSDSAFGSAKTLLTSASFATSELTAGAVLLDAVIPNGVERYIRAYYTFGAAHDSGKLDAHITLDTAKGVDKQY
jgi:hypothetical protein